MKIKQIAYVNENLPNYWKPYYIFEIYVNDSDVGNIVLREGTMQERYYDGHIGYTIKPEYQGHYYACEATLLVLEVAKEKGFKDILITCSPNNIASKKTIQKLQARYIETKAVPKEWMKYFDKEEKIKEIYYISL